MRTYRSWGNLGTHFPSRSPSGKCATGRMICFQKLAGDDWKSYGNLGERAGSRTDFKFLPIFKLKWFKPERVMAIHRNSTRP